MKLLRLYNNGKNTEAQFYDISQENNGVFDEKYYKRIELIENEDVKDLLTYIFSHDETDLFDTFVEGSLQNPAQNVIYKDLYEELSKVNESKEGIIKKVDDSYKAIEEKYKE